METESLLGLVMSDLSADPLWLLLVILLCRVSFRLRWGLRCGPGSRMERLDIELGYSSRPSARPGARTSGGAEPAEAVVRAATRLPRVRCD